MKTIPRLLLASLLSSAFFFANPSLAEAAPVWLAEVLSSQKHHSTCYTQGLFIHQEKLFESCGQYGQSSFSRRNFPSNLPSPVELRYDLAPEFFAEGAVIVPEENRVYLLTWRENICIMLNSETLTEVGRRPYDSEGWGLAYDGATLWRSDGSAKLYPHHPGDFKPNGEAVVVRLGTREVTGLNELEWDKETDLLLANVYGQDYIIAIDLTNGQVAFVLDAKQLRKLAQKDGLDPDLHFYDTVLNGLALNEEGLWVTGKYWPSLYLLKWPPTGFKK